MILLSDGALDLQQQPELASELEFNVQGTADCGQKWPVSFNAGITQLVSFDRSNDSGAIDVKTIGPILEKKNHIYRDTGTIFFF